MVICMRNVLYDHMYVSTWSVIEGSVQEGLGDAGLQEETHHWRQALRVCSLSSLPACSLSFL